jgi:phosphatidylglycerophosphate synthase
VEHEAFRRQWSGLHGGVEPSGLVGGWLRIGHALAAPLARLGVAPDVVTGLAVLVALAAVPVAAPRGHWLLPAALLVAVSGLLDGLDGPLAVLRGRVSRWGYVLDSVADRVSEAGFAAALVVAGAPGWAAAGWVGAGWLQEYLRARAAAAGMAGIEVITVSERPTRIAVAAMFLLGAGLYPSAAGGWLAVGTWAGLAVGLVGLVQLLVVAHRRLTGPAAGGGRAADGGASADGGRPAGGGDAGHDR